MKTYCIDMTHRFDWFHFKVVAESKEEAIRVVENAVDEFNPEDYADFKYWKKLWKKNYPQIVDYLCDKDDLEYGEKYPEISLGDFTVISGNYNPNSAEDYKQFETYEEFIDYLNSLKKSYTVETSRGWHVSF